MVDISDEQLDYLEDQLDLDLTAQTQVANETMDFFVQRAEQEGLSPDGMVAAIRCVAELVEEAVEEVQESGRGPDDGV